MDKRGKTWQSMSISNEVFDKLDVMREKAELEIGMKLSWTKFFSRMIREFERLTPKPAPAPAPRSALPAKPTVGQK